MARFDITERERPGDLSGKGFFTGCCRPVDDFGQYYGEFPIDILAPETETCAPYVDIKEMADVFQLDAELPGMGREDINVSVQDGILTLKGERTEKDGESVSCRYVERECESFARDFALPDHTDAERIQAVFKNGVLRITLPKTQQVTEEARRIPVSAA
jgi:HSP20 family protein